MRRVDIDPGAHNVIIIDATAALSGGGVYLIKLLTALLPYAPKYKFILFCFDRNNQFDSLSHYKNLKICNVLSGALKTENSIIALIKKLWWRQLILPIHIYRYRPLLVFSNCGFGPLCRMMRVPFLYAIHNSIPFQGVGILNQLSLQNRIRAGILKTLLLLTLRNGDGIIVFSRDLHGNIKRIVKESIIVITIPHGIDDDYIEMCIDKDAYAIDRFYTHSQYFVYVSHIYNYKNIIRLLDAFEMLLHDSPDYYLMIIGKPYDRKYYNILIKKIGMSKRLSSRVIILSNKNRDDVIRIISMAHGFIFPSIVENCPLAVLEAMAVGCPMAVSEIPSLIEILQDSALYYNPYDTKDICQKMKMLINDNKMRENLKIKAKIRSKEYSWNLSASQTFDFMNVLIKSSLLFNKNTIKRI